MDNEIGAINCETVELDHAAKNYAAFLQSLRVLRGLLGFLTWIVFAIPLFFAIVSYDFLIRPPDASFFISWEFTAVITIFFLLVISVWYVFFYLLRSLAAGSVRSARCAVAVMSPVLVLNVLSLGFYVCVLCVLGYIGLFFTPGATVTQPPSSSIFSMIAPLIFWNFVGVYIAYLSMAGLVRRIRNRHQPFQRIFCNPKHSRKFWPGWAGLLRSFWLVIGIPVPPRPIPRATRVTRVALAAVCAFMLEGGLLTAYMWPTTPGMLMRHEPYHREYEQYEEEVSRLAEFATGVILIPFIMAACWGQFALWRILRRYARRQSLLLASDAMLADPRKPVLFLRSFSDDQVSLSKAKMPRLLRFVDPGSVIGTLEELIVSEYADVGPVITIGKPSEDPDDLPPIGAAREYCQGTEWQEIVCSLMQASALIVVGVGQFPGLAWEIATLRSMNVLTKTLFVFPPDLAKDRLMLHDLLTKLGFGGKILQFQSDQAVISVSFGAAGRPLLLLSSRISEIVYQVTVRAAKQPDILPRSSNL